MRSVLPAIVAMLSAAPGHADVPTASATDSPPASLAGWAELNLRIDSEGAFVEVDDGHFCPLPCRMLVQPGSHRFGLTTSELETTWLEREIGANESLRIEGDLEGTATDGVGIALWVIGAAAVLTAASLVSWDVVDNVSNGHDDWSVSYASIGIGLGGLGLAIWGAVRAAGGEPEPLSETRETR